QFLPGREFGAGHFDREGAGGLVRVRGFAAAAGGEREREQRREGGRDGDPRPGARSVYRRPPQSRLNIPWRFAAPVGLRARFSRSQHLPNGGRPGHPIDSSAEEEQMVGTAVNRAFLPAKSLFEQVGDMMILTARTLVSAVKPPY